MGNAHSTQANPDGSPKDSLAPRRPPGRKGSAGAQSAKASPLAPAESLDIATSHSTPIVVQRGRSQSIPQDKLEPTNAESPTRSRSPRPPLNVDTSNPAELDLQRTTSNSQSTTSDSPTPFYATSSQFGRPPRLPLPIEEETLAPGSPAPGSPSLAPEDYDGSKDKTADPLNRTTSVLSSNTLDDDDDPDDEIYRADELKGPVINTLIEWKEGGERVYVTGTFCAWQKKSRLHRNGPSKTPNTFSAVIGLPPGTWYLSFLVDGLAKAATHMPTTVDYTNALVNYIHIPDDESLNEPAHGPFVPPPKESLPPPPSDVIPLPAPIEPQKNLRNIPSWEDEARPQRKNIRKKPDERKYHNEIPQFLLDYDGPEGSQRVKRANAVSESHQPPPQLPPYLQKSILSTVTPMKDDSSVLVLPNHTVLNHLATSSIKEGVLGTSATTRYYKKVCRK